LDQACIFPEKLSSLSQEKNFFRWVLSPPPSVRFFHRLCAVLSRGGGRDFVLSFLPSSPPPSAAISHPLSVAVSSFFFSFFPLSSGLVTQPPRVRSTLPSRPPMAFLHPLPSRRSRFFSGAQLQLFPSPICKPSILHSSDAPHQGLPHRPSYPSMPSPPRSSHHTPPRDQHVLARKSHAPARGSHTPSACISRAAVSASSWC
jgi:hypothetical protein